MNKKHHASIGMPLALSMAMVFSLFGGNPARAQTTGGQPNLAVCNGSGAGPALLVFGDGAVEGAPLIRYYASWKRFAKDQPVWTYTDPVTSSYQVTVSDVRPIPGRHGAVLAGFSYNDASQQSRVEILDIFKRGKTVAAMDLPVNASEGGIGTIGVSDGGSHAYLPIGTYNWGINPRLGDIDLNNWTLAQIVPATKEIHVADFRFDRIGPRLIYAEAGERLLHIADIVRDTTGRLGGISGVRDLPAPYHSYSAVRRPDREEYWIGGDTQIAIADTSTPGSEQVVQWINLVGTASSINSLAFHSDGDICYYAGNTLIIGLDATLTPPAAPAELFRVDVDTLGYGAGWQLLGLLTYRNGGGSDVVLAWARIPGVPGGSQRFFVLDPLDGSLIGPRSWVPDMNIRGIVVLP